MAQATVFHPTTGQRKVVTVGDPNAFSGGFVLETPTDSYQIRQKQQATAIKPMTPAPTPAAPPTPTYSNPATPSVPVSAPQTPYSAPSTPVPTYSTPQAPKPALPVIPGSVYSNYQQRIQSGSVTPQQARAEIEGLLNPESGSYSGSFDASKLFTPGLTFRDASGGVYEFDNSLSGNSIKKSTTVQQTTVSPTGYTTGSKETVGGVGPTAPIPFKDGLSDVQKQSITTLVSQKPTSQWTVTDRANWDYATNKAPLPSLGGSQQQNTSIPFKEGLSDQQKAGIQNLANKPTAQWTDTDRKNWAYATNNAPPPQVGQAPAQPAVPTGAPATPAAPSLPPIPTNTGATPSGPPTLESITGGIDVSTATDDQILQRILNSMMPSKEETEISTDLTNLEAGRRKSFTDIEGQPIAIPFITGQEAAVQKSADLQRQTLQDRLALMQAQRTAALDASKFALEFRTGQTAAKQAASRPVSVGAGSSLIDPTTGKVIYAPPIKPEEVTSEKEIVADLATKYPDAGITLNDSLSTAQAKLSGSRIYQQSTRLASGGGGSSSGGGSTRPVVPTTGNGETVQVDPIVESWAQNIINGKANIASVPKDIKNNVSLRVAELEKQGITKPASVKFSPAQQEDMATMDTVQSQINQVLGYYDDKSLEGVGFVTGPVGSLFTKVFGSGSEEAKSVRALIGNIKAVVAKLRGGTSFTENEEKLLDQYVPNINESDASVINKLKILNNMISTKRGALLQTAQPQSLNQPQGASGQTSSGLKYTIIP